MYSTIYIVLQYSVLLSKKMYFHRYISLLPRQSLLLETCWTQVELVIRMRNKKCRLQRCVLKLNIFWVVVSNIFYFHPYVGKIPILTNSFQRGWNHQLVINFQKKQHFAGCWCQIVLTFTIGIPYFCKHVMIHDPHWSKFSKGSFNVYTPGV